MDKLNTPQTEVLVCLNSIDKVKKFVNLTGGIDEPMDLHSGRYVIDAKSIMGIFSLDLSKNINMTIYADTIRAVEIKTILKDYIVE